MTFKTMFNLNNAPKRDKRFVIVCFFIILKENSSLIFIGVYLYRSDNGENNS